MSDWVSTDKLASLIERHIRGAWYKLAERSGIDKRQLTRIRSRETKVTSFNIADKILTELGLNSSLDIKSIPKPRKARRPQVANRAVKKHGTQYAYIRLGCGCAECRHANTLRKRQQRANKRVLTNKGISDKVTVRTLPKVSESDTEGVRQ